MTDNSTLATHLSEIAKHFQNLAKGHASAAALRDRFGVHLPTPGATQPGQPGAPGASPGFSPTVARHVQALTAKGWQHVQSGGSHFLRGPGGKVVRFDPTTGAMAVVSNGQVPTLA